MKIELTRSELAAVQWATGQHSDSNANDIDVMMSEGLTRWEAKALVSANMKIRQRLNYKPLLKREEALNNQ